MTDTAKIMGGDGWTRFYPVKRERVPRDAPISTSKPTVTTETNEESMLSILAEDYQMKRAREI